MLLRKRPVCKKYVLLKFLYAQIKIEKEKKKKKKDKEKEGPINRVFSLCAQSVIL